MASVRDRQKFFNERIESEKSEVCEKPKTLPKRVKDVLGQEIKSKLESIVNSEKNQLELASDTLTPGRGNRIFTLKSTWDNLESETAQDVSSNLTLNTKFQPSKGTHVSELAKQLRDQLLIHRGPNIIIVNSGADNFQTHLQSRIKNSLKCDEDTNKYDMPKEIPVAKLTPQYPYDYNVQTTASENNSLAKCDNLVDLSLKNDGETFEVQKSTVDELNRVK